MTEASSCQTTVSMALSKDSSLTSLKQAKLDIVRSTNMPMVQYAWQTQWVQCNMQCNNQDDVIVLKAPSVIYECKAVPAYVFSSALRVWWVLQSAPEGGLIP